MDVEKITKEEAGETRRLWFGVLGSPLAWAVHLAANYSLEEWFACSPATEAKGKILGIGVDTVAIVINTAMAAIALASGLVAYSCWKTLRAAGGDEPGERDERIDRARWMAFAGMVECALFLGIILLGYLPPFQLGDCETTP